MDGAAPSYAIGAQGAAIRSHIAHRGTASRNGPLHERSGRPQYFLVEQLDDGKIGRVDAKGKITVFPLPDPTGGSPDDIVGGSDGPLWFTMPNGFPDAIGRVSTDGQFETFGAGCAPGGGCSIVPQGITSGPDGNLWFTENTRNAVVRLTPSGAFTFFTVPTAGANPHGITTGPDGALWFTEFNANKIGRRQSRPPWMMASRMAMPSCLKAVMERTSRTPFMIDTPKRAAND